jgi:uncharacterized protein with PIN domain
MSERSEEYLKKVWKELTEDCFRLAFQKSECPYCGEKIKPKIAKPRMGTPFPNRRMPYCPKCGKYLPKIFIGLVEEEESTKAKP